MKKVFIGILIGAMGFYSFNRISHPRPAPAAEFADTGANQAPAPVEPASEQPSRFHCDGRVYCSQMTSCEEATYFLQHCPGVKMDGEGDGVPCERQWCGSH